MNASNNNQQQLTFEERVQQAREANRKAVQKAWNLATMPYRMSAR